MSNKDEFEFIQWGFDLVKNAYLNKSETTEERDRLYSIYLYPFSKEIYTLNNSVLLFGGHSFKSFDEKTVLTLRDGLIPLSIFFTEMRPEDISQEIYIHKDFWFLVPKEWREKIKFFDLRSDIEYSAKKLPKKIFVTGILNSTLADPEELETSLQHLVNTIGAENLKNIDVSAYFPDKRTDLWGSWDEENILTYSKLLYKYLGIDMKTPLWRDVKLELDMRDSLYYEVNTGLFIKDSYMTHFSLSRGAGLLASDSADGDDRFKLISELRTSLYHKYKFYEFDFSKVKPFVDPLDSDYKRYFKRLLEFQNKDIRLNFEWEKWYASYIKRYYKMNKQGRRDIFKA